MLPSSDQLKLVRDRIAFLRSLHISACGIPYWPLRAFLTSRETSVLTYWHGSSNGWRILFSVWHLLAIFKSSCAELFFRFWCLLIAQYWLAEFGACYTLSIVLRVCILQLGSDPNLYWRRILRRLKHGGWNFQFVGQVIYKWIPLRVKEVLGTTNLQETAKSTHHADDNFHVPFRFRYLCHRFPSKFRQYRRAL